MKRHRLALPLLLSASAVLAACRSGDPSSGIVASGHVEATEVLVSSEVPGTLVKLVVDEGATVTAGQELAQVDTADTELQLAAARAERATAAAELRLHGELIVKLSDILGVSSEELLGLKKAPSNGVLKNRRLLRRLQAIERLPRRDQQALLRTIDRFLDSFRTG